MKTFGTRKSWIVMIGAWLGICLALLALASCSLQRAAVEQQGPLRVKVTLAPGSDETALFAVVGAAAGRWKPVLPMSDAARPAVYQLDFRSEQELKIFLRRAEQQGLPVLAVQVEKAGN